MLLYAGGHDYKIVRFDAKGPIPLDTLLLLEILILLKRSYQGHLDCSFQKKVSIICNVQSQTETSCQGEEETDAKKGGSNGVGQRRLRVPKMKLSMELRVLFLLKRAV
jgi:hypothetical protein